MTNKFERVKQNYASNFLNPFSAIEIIKESDKYLNTTVRFIIRDLDVRFYTQKRYVNANIQSIRDILSSSIKEGV